MKRFLMVIIFVFFFVLLTNSFIYAERECTSTVTCSDGTELIDTSCTSSYTIVDGHYVNDNSDDIDNSDHDHHHHHNHWGDDPCRFGHGHRIDNDFDNDDSMSDNAPDNHDDNASDNGPLDPYNLMHGHPHNYDPNDPYGLRQNGN